MVGAPLRPSRYPSSLRRPLFCLMFERAFIPQILRALMNNTWASVANPHPPHSALSNTHKHSASYLLCRLHPQMAWPRSFPLWMQDNWICRSVVFCCPDRSVYRNKKTHSHTNTHTQANRGVVCLCLHVRAYKSFRTPASAALESLLALRQFTNSGSS